MPADVLILGGRPRRGRVVAGAAVTLGVLVALVIGDTLQTEPLTEAEVTEALDRAYRPGGTLPPAGARAGR